MAQKTTDQCRNSRSVLLMAALAVASGFGPVAEREASALDLDWSGQFSSEAHFVDDYQFGNTRDRDATRDGQGGYYIPGGGSDDAHFQTLFLRLRPKAVVNDNVYIKSEWWVGDPTHGFFGNAAPYPADQRRYSSTYSRGSSITAQRFWGEFLSDMGTFQVGRVPLDYGLGLVWDSGDDLFSKYQSTGDAIRLISKFGAFTFVPSIIKYSMGNNIGGGCNFTSPTCTPTSGGAGLSDFSLMFKYENLDEEFEGGVNFIRRIAGAGQDVDSGFQGIAPVGQTPVSAGMNFNTWDIFGRKKIGKFTIAGELPITTGDIGGLQYRTYALALETGYRASDSWDFYLKGGHAPGQSNAAGTAAGTINNRYRAFYFHPNYKIALIMFNYQFANFVGPNTQNDPTITGANQTSPWDASIVNANYLSWGGSYHTNKWSFRAGFAWASAREAAEAGSSFFNVWDRRYYANTSGKSQSKALGWEMDYGTTFRWDDAFQFHLDFGWYYPGAFYKFSNTTVDNKTDAVFASVFKVGVNF